MSIHCLCSIGIVSQPLVDDGFNLGFAFAPGFTEAFSSSWIGMASRLNVLSVCHKLLSISLPHEQIGSQTIKYQASQYVPNIDVSEQFVSKQLIILQLISSSLN